MILTLREKQSIIKICSKYANVRKEVGSLKHLKLKALMIENGLTQADMSKILGINASTFSKKINGKKDFTITEIETIKDYFNLPYEEIFFRVNLREKRKELEMVV